jgi:hypothetical protein
MSPDAIVSTLRKFGLSLDIEAANLIEKLQAENAQMLSIIAKISYCSAQCGADAMEMRNIAMDFMRGRSPQDSSP